METSIANLIDDWGLRTDIPAELRNPHEVQKRIDFLVRHLALEKYEPMLHDHAAFWERLRKWLKQADKARDKALLLQILFQLMYLGGDEYSALYKAAFREHVIPWLVELRDLDLCSPHLDEEIWDAVGETCFSAVTDSMRINPFHTVNNIGNGFRPEWRSILGATSGCSGCDKMSTGLLDHMAKKGLKRIVVLEDFVGSLTQGRKILEFVSSLGVEVLFLPLVICPAGHEIATDMQRSLPHFRYRPVYPLAAEMFMRPNGQSVTPLLKRFAKFAESTYCTVTDGVPQSADDAPYSPYGKYDTGALFVKYTNCPNNTIPLIHHSSDSWDALFPRSARG